MGGAFPPGGGAEPAPPPFPGASPSPARRGPAHSALVPPRCRPCLPPSPPRDCDGLGLAHVLRGTAHLRPFITAQPQLSLFHQRRCGLRSRGWGRRQTSVGGGAIVQPAADRAAGRRACRVNKSFPGPTWVHLPEWSLPEWIGVSPGRGHLWTDSCVSPRAPEMLEWEGFTLGL